jgi:hypothetical protein
MFLRWLARWPRSGWPLAQSQPAAAATAAAQPQTKPTAVLDHPAKGVLLIGIDRIDAQNRIDIPTFSAIGQAYYQFEHDDDLKVAVLHGKGRISHRASTRHRGEPLFATDRSRHRKISSIRLRPRVLSAPSHSSSLCKGM